MKKAVSLLIAVLLLLMFTACGDSVVGTWELCGGVNGAEEYAEDWLESGETMLFVFHEDGSVYMVRTQMDREDEQYYYGSFDSKTKCITSSDGGVHSYEIKNDLLYVQRSGFGGEQMLVFQKR